MNAYTITIPGKPTGKGRPRRGANGNMYTPDTTREYEQIVKMAWVTRHPGTKLKGPVSISISAWFKEPKKKSFALPTVKPDIDNIIKIVLDGLNGLAYDDDKQVIGVVATKGYSSEECVVVSIGEVPE